MAMRIFLRRALARSRSMSIGLMVMSGTGGSVGAAVVVGATGWRSAMSPSRSTDGATGSGKTTPPGAPKLVVPAAGKLPVTGRTLPPGPKAPPIGAIGARGGNVDPMADAANEGDGVVGAAVVVATGARVATGGEVVIIETGMVGCCALPDTVPPCIAPSTESSQLIPEAHEDISMYTEKNLRRIPSF